MTANYCPDCGEDLQQYDEPAYCPGCGSEVGASSDTSASQSEGFSDGYPHAEKETEDLTDEEFADRLEYIGEEYGEEDEEFGEIMNVLADSIRGNR